MMSKKVLKYHFPYIKPPSVKWISTFSKQIKETLSSFSQNVVGPTQRRVESSTHAKEKLKLPCLQLQTFLPQLILPHSFHLKLLLHHIRWDHNIRITITCKKQNLQKLHSSFLHNVDPTPFYSLKTKHFSLKQPHAGVNLLSTLLFYEHSLHTNNSLFILFPKSTHGKFLYISTNALYLKWNKTSSLFTPKDVQNSSL